MRLVSLNLRIAKDAAMNNQGIREPRMAAFVRDIGAAAIGVQECSDFWRSRLDATWTGYRRVQPDPETPETFKNYVFYDPAKAELLDGGRFWLSDTPETASKGFGSRFFISAGWAKLRVPGAKKPLVFVNTHLDVYSEETRIAEIGVLMAHIRRFLAEGSEVFVSGDFNARIGSAAHALMGEQKELREYRTLVPAPALDYTFNGYMEEGVPTPQERHIWIDHAYCSAGIVPQAIDVVEQYAGGNMSDHNAVIFDFTLN